MGILDPGAGRFLDVDGLRTFYVQAGASGDPVVLVHGAAPGACAQLSWHPNVGPLAAAGFRVYAFDQPGFGYTENPTDHSLERRVAHARAFVDALGLDRFHLVGNSVGAYVAARLALDLGERVRRLVLVSSSVLAPPGSPEAQAQARAHAEALRSVEPTLEAVRELSRGTLFDQDLATEEFVRARYEMCTGSRYEALLARRQAPPAPRLTDELPRLRVPTLILWGRNDRGAAVERALGLQACIPGSELHVFDRCAHWVQWDQAERFNQVVAGFLGAGGPTIAAGEMAGARAASAAR